MAQDYLECIYSSNIFEDEDIDKVSNERLKYESIKIEDENIKAEDEEVNYKNEEILYNNINNCSCGDILVQSTSSTLICNNCGTTRDIGDDFYANNDGGGYKELPVHRKMRIIGEDSAKYRSDLFRCSNSCENELQVKCEIIFEELVNIHEKYMTNQKLSTKLQITKNNLKDVAIYYTLCTIPSNGSVANIYSTYGMTNEEDIRRYSDYVHRIQNCIYHGTKKEDHFKKCK